MYEKIVDPENRGFMQFNATTLVKAMLMTMFLLTQGAHGIMTVEDIVELESGTPGTKIAYGDDPLQFGELQVPKGDGPFPVVMFIHGGCWYAKYDITTARPLASALIENGYAVWNLEYRRIGNPGGGYPGTLLDVGAGADHLKRLARQHPLDLSRLVVMGHSAGGHLALWTAARHKIVEGHALYQANPIPVRGVVALAPASDLALIHQEKQCRDVAQKFLGGSPAEVPERYQFADTGKMGPLGIPQILILGDHDEIWTPVAKSYMAKGRALGDTQITPVVAPESGHFEMIDPRTSTFPLVLDAVRALSGAQ